MGTTTLDAIGVIAPSVSSFKSTTKEPLMTQEERFKAYAARIESEFDGPRANPVGAKLFFHNLSTIQIQQVLAVLPRDGKLAKLARRELDLR
jgi:hypothetical protein